MPGAELSLQCNASCIITFYPCSKINNLLPPCFKIAKLLEAFGLLKDCEMKMWGLHPNQK
jgi:hypothetical protein